MNSSNYSDDGQLSVSAVSSFADEPEGSRAIELSYIRSERFLNPEASKPSQRESTESERAAYPEPGSYLGLLGHEDASERHPAEEIENLANTLGSFGSLIEENEATRPKSGLWKRQMLVDRSLRGMAALMTAYAVILTASCISLLPEFIRNMRISPYSSSVSISHGQCSTMAHESEVLKIFINIAATTVLGMSNTYQQLITALNIDDLTYVLSKYGDARVGTNSPLAISHKRSCRVRSWICWWLLICTSLPVHFLANSLTVFCMDRPVLKIEKEAITNVTNISLDLPPWICVAGLNFTTVTYSSSLHGDSSSYHYDDPYYLLANNSRTAAAMKIHYDPQFCSPGHASQKHFPGYKNYTEERTPSRCMDHISCMVTKWEDNCHLVFRMQAGLVLATCLISKAVYMLIVGLASRRSNKKQCLTFGDAIIAARLCSLDLSSECMLDAGDSHRRRDTHKCHQHCRKPEVSSTGHEHGHCRKCTGFNTTSELEDFPTPARATKQKRPLLSHLGQMALAQLIVVCSVAAAALTIAAPMVGLFISENAWDKFTETHLRPIVVYNLGVEFLIMCATNFPQFFFSILYLFLIYNLTLINMEYEWGKMETSGGRLRCSLVVGEQFDQSYYLGLPMKVLVPTMSFSALVHWIVSMAIQVTEERYYTLTGYDTKNVIAINLAVCVGCAGLLLLIAILCWVALSYRRNGFIPSMFGSVRVLCAAAGELHDIPRNGHIKWGDLGESPLYRRAGLSGGPVGEIVPEELYAGCSSETESDSA